MYFVDSFCCQYITLKPKNFIADTLYFSSWLFHNHNIIPLPPLSLRMERNARIFEEKDLSVTDLYEKAKFLASLGLHQTRLSRDTHFDSQFLIGKMYWGDSDPLFSACLSWLMCSGQTVCMYFFHVCFTFLEDSLSSHCVLINSLINEKLFQKEKKRITII